MDAKIEKIYGLTPMQEGILYHKLADEKSTAYVIQMAFAVAGALDAEKTRRSLGLLSKKYEALRTVFVFQGKSEKPLQVVMRDREIELNVVAAADPDEKERYKKADVARGFDLTKDSLLRLAIIRAGEGACTLLWTAHHIIMDGWCFPLLLRDFFAFYAADGKSGAAEAETGPALPFSEYVKWLGAQNKKEALGYWGALLYGYDSAVTIPPLGLAGREDAAPNRNNFIPGRDSLSLSEEATAAVAALASGQNVTVNTVLETAWGLLLQKYNRTDDAVYGKVVSGRGAGLPGIEQAVGLFINTIPVRVRTGSESASSPPSGVGGASVAGLLAEMQAQALESMKYEYAPLAEVQDASKVGSSLIQTVFVFENYYIDEALYNGSDGMGAELESAREEVNYGVALTASMRGVLRLDLLYDSGAYTQGEAKLVLGRLAALLAEMAENPHKKVSALAMLARGERERILAEFNDTAADYRSGKTFAELFEEQAALAPENTALEFGDAAMSYGELNAKANGLARRLRKAGIGPGCRVALIAERSMEMIIGLLGTVKAGGAYVPIDPGYPGNRIAYLLNDCAPKAVLTYGAKAPEGFERITVDLADGAVFEGGAENLPLAAGPCDLIYVIYTSGTTGNPKGVMIEHRGVTNLKKFYDIYDTAGPENCVLQFASLTFDAHVPELLMSLLSGSKLLLCRTEDTKDADRLCDLVDAKNVTVMLLPPQLLNQMRPVRAHTLLTGGSAAIPECVGRIVKSAKYANQYGPTETSVCASYWNAPPDIKRVPARIPIGRPIFNTQIYILNGAELCGIGIPGELCIAGDGLARGYLNRPELTAEKFVPNPFGNGRMYRTGDLARWLPDGNIDYLGRMDAQVKIRGFRIEPGEIESALRKQPGVSDAAVVAREIGGDLCLCAYLTPARYSPGSGAQQIKDALRLELPEYMIPAFITRVEALPVNRSGKLDEAALPAPETASGKAYAPPASAMERAAAEAFEEALGVSPIGIDDSFYERGGNSIKAIRVVSKMRQKGYEIAVADLIQHRTVRLLCQKTEAARKKDMDIVMLHMPDGGGADKSGGLIKTVEDCLSRYGDNYLKSDVADSRAITVAEGLFDGRNIIADIICCECGAAAVSDALKRVVSRQGVLRLRLNCETGRLEEYAYTSAWDIPVADGGSGLSVLELKTISGGLNYHDGKLLSRFAILETDGGGCALISMIDHMVWDLVSHDMFKAMLQEALARGDGSRKSYSYVGYGKAIEENIRKTGISAENEAEKLRFLDAVIKANGFSARKDPYCVTEVFYRLEEAQREKFEKFPIETAMELMSGLLYGGYEEEPQTVPYGVLMNKRDESNNEILGLLLDVECYLYDAAGKTRAPVESIEGLRALDGFASTETIRNAMSQLDPGFFYMAIPFVSYIGIYNISPGGYALPPGKTVMTRVMEIDEMCAALIQFRIEEDMLIMEVDGVRVGDEDVLEAMKRI